MKPYRIAPLAFPASIILSLASIPSFAFSATPDNAIMSAVFDGKETKTENNSSGTGLVYAQKKENTLVFSAKKRKDIRSPEAVHRGGDISVSNGKVSTRFPIIKGGKELSNETIDQIFISISKELEKERALKAKQAEEARLKRIAQKEEEMKLIEAQAKDIPVPEQITDPKELDAANAAMNPGLAKEENEEKSGVFSAIPLGIKFYGTICNIRGCVVLSSAGILKKGSKIEESNETIKRITRTHIYTNLRKIKI